jgi:MFS family permease
MAAEDKVLDESASTREEYNAAPEQDLDNTVKYSVFTKTEKWIIVAMASNAAWFSTLSSFIYYPAIPSLSESLNESVGRINLTVTTYMAIASIAPALVGDTADVLGRRPVYILTLGLYFVANIAIALTKSYASLLGLRVLQALAVSGKMARKRIPRVWV